MPQSLTQVRQVVQWIQNIPNQSTSYHCANMISVTLPKIQTTINRIGRVKEHIYK